jgi:hypothetical protein
LLPATIYYFRKKLWIGHAMLLFFFLFDLQRRGMDWCPCADAW